MKWNSYVLKPWPLSQKCSLKKSNHKHLHPAQVLHFCNPQWGEIQEECSRKVPFHEHMNYSWPFHWGQYSITTPQMALYTPETSQYIDKHCNVIFYNQIRRCHVYVRYYRVSPDITYCIWPLSHLSFRSRSPNLIARLYDVIKEIIGLLYGKFADLTLVFIRRRSTFVFHSEMSCNVPEMC